MQITTRKTSPDYVVDKATAAQVEADVCAALQAIRTQGDRFVVNDTIWYWTNPRGHVKATVVNRGLFHSGTFEKRAGLPRLGEARKAESPEDRRVPGSPCEWTKVLRRARSVPKLIRGIFSVRRRRFAVPASSQALPRSIPSSRPWDRGLDSSTPR